MNKKLLLGLLLGFSIGLICSLFTIPVPAPPVITGSLLVITMTSGYLLADRYFCAHRTKVNEKYCGGPHAETKLPKDGL